MLVGTFGKVVRLTGGGEVAWIYTEKMPVHAALAGVRGTLSGVRSIAIKYL